MALFSLIMHIPFKNSILTLVLFAFLSACNYAQNPAPVNSTTPCPVEGNAKPERIKDLNKLKDLRKSFPFLEDADEFILRD